MHNRSQWEPPNHPNSWCGPARLLLFCHSADHTHSLTHWLANEKLIALRPCGFGATCPFLRISLLSSFSPTDKKCLANSPEVQRSYLWTVRGACTWHQHQTADKRDGRYIIKGRSRQDNHENWKGKFLVSPTQGDFNLIKIWAEKEEEGKWFNYRIGTCNDWKMKILYTFI